MKYLVIVFILILATGCATTKLSTYEQLGGHEKVQEIVDNFISEIEFSPIMFEYFKDSDINRFREKLVEHVCSLTGGGCEYTGDTMEQVHAGMNISESDFNLGVDLFINAMEKANIPHRIQNKVLADIAPTRKNMIYL
jgi:hemoglobin